MLETQGMNESFHSNQSHGSHVTSLELENRLLKNEMQSLNEEMTAVIKRAKDSQEGSFRWT